MIDQVDKLINDFEKDKKVDSVLLKKFEHEFFLRLSKKRLKESYKKDNLIIQLVQSIDDLDKVINLLYERILEFYGLYYPEAMRKMRDKSLDEIISILNDPGRESVSAKLSISSDSMGYDLDAVRINLLKSLVKQAGSVVSFKEKVKEDIESLMKETAPNLTNLVGGVLGARLINHAGSIERLAKMPSSTIQIVGAEKSLFRHLKKGSRPPKHGIIFQHPMIKTSRKDDRGRIARSLAAKLAIAAKIDYYSKGRKVEESLVEKMKRRTEK